MVILLSGFLKFHDTVTLKITLFISVAVVLSHTQKTTWWCFGTDITYYFSLFFTFFFICFSIWVSIFFFFKQGEKWEILLCPFQWWTPFIWPCHIQSTKSSWLWTRRGPAAHHCHRQRGLWASFEFLCSLTSASWESGVDWALAKCSLVIQCVRNNHTLLLFLIS